MVDTRSSKKSSNSDTVAASPGQKVKPVKAEKRQDKRRVPKPVSNSPTPKSKLQSAKVRWDQKRKYWAGTKTQPGASCNCRPCQKAGWIMGHPRCANRPCNGKKPCNNCKKQKRIDQCRYAERYSQEERIAGDKDTRGTAASMEDTNASPFTTEPEDSYTASLVPMASGSTLGNEAGKQLTLGNDANEDGGTANLRLSGRSRLPCTPEQGAPGELRSP